MANIRDQPIEHTMSFGDHLEELRRRVLWAIVPLLPLAVIAYPFSNTIIGWLLLPLFQVLRAHGLPVRVQQLGVAEAVITQLKLSVIAAVILCFPWLIWQLWKFISPGLYHHERRFVNLLLPGSALLTIVGMALLYFVLLPFMLDVLVSVGAGMTVPAPQEQIDPRVAALIEQNPPAQVLVRMPNEPPAGTFWLVWPEMKLHAAVAGPTGGVEILEVQPQRPGIVAQDFRLSDYIGFVLVLALGLALAFQTPLVVMLLGWVGLATPDFLRRHRKHAFMVCAVVAAVITPTTDIVSMLVTLLPIYMLYELGLVLLILAPASAVAEGRVFSVRRFWPRRSADNSAASPPNPTQSAQTERTVPRTPGKDNPDRPWTDGGEGS